MHALPSCSSPPDKAQSTSAQPWRDKNCLQTLLNTSWGGRSARREHQPHPIGHIASVHNVMHLACSTCPSATQLFTLDYQRGNAGRGGWEE